MVGIDIHRPDPSPEFSQAPYPEVLQTYLGAHFPGAEIHCAYEATRFGFWIARELISFGYTCLVVNPADIPSTHPETQNKTDQIDSRKIAKALQAGLLTGSYIPSEELEGDRQLFRYRKRLWSDLVRVKNRIKGTLAFAGIAIPVQYDNAFWTKAFLRWLKEVNMPSKSGRATLDLLLEQYDRIYKHHLDVSRKVRQLAKCSRYASSVQLLQTIPGIGPLTSIQLMVELGDITRFPCFKKLNSFVGFKPTTYSSGEHDWKGHLTIRKHNALRSSLIECAWQTIQKDPVMLIKYEELIKRMTKKRAAVMIARKLLSRIYYVLKYQEPYELGRVS